MRERKLVKSPKLSQEIPYDPTHHLVACSFVGGLSFGNCSHLVVGLVISLESTLAWLDLE